MAWTLGRRATPPLVRSPLATPSRATRCRPPDGSTIEVVPWWLMVGDGLDLLPEWEHRGRHERQVIQRGAAELLGRRVEAPRKSDHRVAAVWDERPAAALLKQAGALHDLVGIEPVGVGVDLGGREPGVAEHVLEHLGSGTPAFGPEEANVCRSEWGVARWPTWALLGRW